MDKAADPREDKKNPTDCQFMQSGFLQIKSLFLSAIVLALLLGCSCAPSGKSVPRSAKGSSEDLLLLSSMGRIYTFNIRDGTLNQVQTPDEIAASNPCWSPDRKTIAYVSGKLEKHNGEESVGVNSYGPWLMDADGDERKELAHVSVGLTGDLFWGPDGGLLYLANRITINGPCSVDMAGEIKSIDVSESSGSAWIFQNGDTLSSTSTFSISPDGKHAVYPSGEGKTILVSPFNGSTIGEAVAIYRLAGPGLGWKFRKVVQPVWVNSEEIVIIDDEIRLFKVTMPGGEELHGPRIYQSNVWRWNFRTDNKEMVAQSEPWEIFYELSLSPKGDALAFLYATLRPDPGREYEPGKEPNPAMLDLQTGKIERFQVSPNKVAWKILNLNWSAQ